MRGAEQRLTEHRVCQIVGITQQRRQTLVRRRLIGPSSKSGASLSDALELAALVLVIDSVGPSDGAVAWAQLQPLLKTVVPGKRMDVVFQLQLGELFLARDDVEVRRRTADHGPVVVIDLGTRLARVADAFRRFAETPSKETQVPRRGSSVVRGFEA